MSAPERRRQTDYFPNVPAIAWTLPNILTVARIAITPVVALLPFIDGYWPKIICLVIFIAASVTDIIDGRLARRYKQVTDLGALLDPIADKLLLLATLVPIWWISRQRHDLYDIPVWGSIPLWVCLLMLGREVAMTGFRWWAKRRGVVVTAQGPGKLKTVMQSIFIGGTIAWFAFRDAIKPMGWETDRTALWWNQFHGGFVAVTLGIAAVLTVYSFLIYLYRYRQLFSQEGR
jgi:CDP-diacylglycerol--glycerol-3-phosphate 3-phosphatidyltransferase